MPRKTPYDEELKKRILYSYGERAIDIIEAYEKLDLNNRGIIKIRKMTKSF